MGDYFVRPHLVVKRKTTADFGISVIDGRLFNQAYRLAEFASNSIIIVEGLNYSDSNVSLDAIRGALISLAQTYRIPVLRTKDQKDTAWHINKLVEQRERIGTNRGVLRGYRPKRLATQKSHLLCSLPGIGKKAADSILDKFGSIENMMKAPVEELLEVPGLGTKTVERIQMVISEEFAEYTIFDSYV